MNIDRIKQQLRDYFAQYYRGDVAAVLGDAESYLEIRAPQVAKPALVLDIDETSLSNWMALDANDFGFITAGTCDALPHGPCGFNAWVRKSTAPAIVPTRWLVETAKRLGVAVFFITGRRESDRQATVANLLLAEYGWTALSMRPDGDTERSVRDFKTDERRKIAAAGYTILVNVGDQMSDLEGGLAECTFKVPNPFYFIP